MIKIEWTLRGNTLCISFLVLHGTQHRRVIKIIKLGDTAATVAENGTLRTRG